MAEQWDVYLSSSWKQRDRVRAMAIRLREAGLKVYDFTDPSCRKVPEIPPERFPDQFKRENGTYREYITRVPEWTQAVLCNKEAIQNSRMILLLLPCGLDAHSDWAYGMGQGCLTAVVGSPPDGERVPTHQWANALLDTDDEGFDWAVAHKIPSPQERPDLYECVDCSPKPGSPALCGRCFYARQEAGNDWIGSRPRA